RIEVIDKGIRRLVLVKDGDDWALDYPVRDAVDPVIGDRLRESLAGLWAERFLPSEKAKNLADLGLDKPERELRVTRDDGSVITLQIGREILGDGDPLSREPPRRYGRVKGFDRLFEIGADPLNGIYVPVETLRDSQLARFTPGNVREVELT